MSGEEGTHWLLKEADDEHRALLDEAGRPRSPSLTDVLVKLEEIEEKIDALGRDVTNIEQSISNGVCGYGAYD